MLSEARLNAPRNSGQAFLGAGPVLVTVRDDAASPLATGGKGNVDDARFSQDPGIDGDGTADFEWRTCLGLR